MPVWHKEARDLKPDPITGAALTRLSGSSIRTENMYCEAPRTNADGSRVAVQRYIDWVLSDTRALLCIDLNTKLICLIDREASGVMVAAPWSGSLYYQRGTMLMRASLDTCTTEPVLDMAKLPPCWQMMSVSHDERYLLYTSIEQAEPELYNIARLDLTNGNCDLLLGKPESNRLGALYNPVRGYDMTISTLIWEGNQRYGVGYLADGDGVIRKTLYSRVHHAGWLGDTGKFAGLLEFDGDKVQHLPQYPDGELMIYSADDTPPRLIPMPDHILFHVSSSRCGKYMVSEGIENAPEGRMPIVVVNVETGKHRELVTDSECTPAGDVGRQPKPYFTADTRHVIYNADPDGIVNVYAATIPEGFLESLD